MQDPKLLTPAERAVLTLRAQLGVTRKRLQLAERTVLELQAKLGVPGAKPKLVRKKTVGAPQRGAQLRFMPYDPIPAPANLAMPQPARNPWWAEHERNRHARRGLAINLPANPPQAAGLRAGQAEAPAQAELALNAVPQVRVDGLAMARARNAFWGLARAANIPPPTHL